MTTYNYWCTHGCYENDNILITKDLKDVDREELCPNCGKPMKRMGRTCNNFLGSFDSKSPEEKKEILKKRARNHEKKDKKLQEYKKHLDSGGKQVKY